MTSTNGVIWDGLDSETNFELSSLVVGNGIFVAVGGYGPILTSTNGVHSTARQSGTRNPFLGAAYGNGIFVAVSIDLAANGCWMIPSASNSRLLL